MRSSSVLAVLATASSTLAAPLEPRANFDPPAGGDITILNYALTLEYLERYFYKEALEKYTKEDFVHDGFNECFYDNLSSIAFDEKTHVSFLAGALGDQAVQEANYSFPYDSPRSFVALASIIESVGVSAYLGAAAAIANDAYLTAAGSILTVESRHSAYIRDALGEHPFPKPFDTPLDFMAVYSLAAQFITGFAPGSPALPFKPFPTLTVAPSDGPYLAGESCIIFSDAFANAEGAGLITAETQAYAVFFSGLDTYYVPATIVDGDYKISPIPGYDYDTKGELAPSGQVYVVISTADGNNTKVLDENVISGVGVLEIGVSKGD